MQRKTNNLDSDLDQKEFLQGKDLSNQTNYGRPPVPEGLSDRINDITFMQIDCDYYSVTEQGTCLLIQISAPKLQVCCSQL
jgi:hypothetical protein